MKRIRWLRCMMILFMAGAVTGGGLLGNAGWSYALEKRDYRELQQTYQMQKETTEEAGGNMRQINQDYVGWLRIPGTPVDYPVVWERGAEKGYYLTHDFSGKEASAGCLFVPDGVPAFTAENMVVLGHNRKDLSMFGSLKRYREAAYLKKHPFIELEEDGGMTRYRIIAVCEKPEGEGESYSFASKEEKKAYIQAAIRSSLHGEPEEWPDVNGRLLTLSTCAAGKKRLVILAGQVKAGGSLRKPSPAG